MTSSTSSNTQPNHFGDNCRTLLTSRGRSAAPHSPAARARAIAVLAPPPTAEPPSSRIGQPGHSPAAYRANRRRIAGIRRALAGRTAHAAGARPAARQSAAGRNDERNTLPSFITKATFFSTVTSATGSPATAIRSA